MTPESYEKQDVKKYLVSLGAYQCWPVQTGYGGATLDCLACINGRFVGIETKQEGYTDSDFTTRQRVTMERMRQAGALVFSGTADEIIQGIAEWLSHTSVVHAAGK